MSDGEPLAADRTGQLGAWAATSVICGTIWLLLEVELRGGMDAIQLDLSLIAVLAGVVTIMGIATSPRASFAGEARVAKDMLCAGLLAMFCLPALMLGVYAVITVVSAGFSLGSWTVWALVWAAAALVTVALYGGAIAGALMVIVGLGNPGLLFPGALLAGGSVGAAYGLSVWLGTSIQNMMVWGLPRRVEAWTRWIKPWSYVIAGLRSQIAFIDHDLAVSLVASGAAGVGAGLLLALVLRQLRQNAMRQPAWRSLLPGGLAPLPDGTPWLPAELISPAVGLMALLWLGLMGAVLL